MSAHSLLFHKTIRSVSAHFLLFNILLFKSAHLSAVSAHSLLLQYISNNRICFSTFSAVYHSLFKSAHLSAVSAHFLLFQYISNNSQQFFCCIIKTLLHIHSFLFQHIICCIYIYFTHTISAHFLLFQHIFCCNRTFLHTNLFNSVNTIAIHNYDRRQTFCDTTQIIPKWNTSTHVKEIKYF